MAYADEQLGFFSVAYSNRRMPTNNSNPPSRSQPWDCLTVEPMPPPKQGYASDTRLKMLIKRLIKKQTGATHTRFPKDIGRARLLELATTLNIISAEDAQLTAAPRKNGGPTSWAKRVERAEPRDSPLFDGEGFVTDRQLKAALEAHLGDGVRAPEAIGRKTLLTQALAMNLLSEEQAAAPAPAMIDTATLKKMMAAHTKADHLDGGKERSKSPSLSRKELLEALLAAGLLSEAEADAKKIRADRSATLLEGYKSVQACRKTSVSALFHGVPNAAGVKAELIKVSEEASRLFYQRSFLVWLHLARLVEEGVQLPDMEGDQLDRFVRQAYTIRTKGSSVKNPELDKTYKKHKQLFPILPRPKQKNVVTHAANSYAGSLRRHFANADTVKQRIKRFASARLFGVSSKPPPQGEADADTDDADDIVGERQDVGDSPLYNVISALECKGFKEEAMHPRQVEVLNEIRKLIGLPQGTELDSNWLRVNIHSSIRFSLATVKVLDDLREQAEVLHQDVERRFPDKSTRPKLKKGCARGLHFAPLNALKRRFITVDASDMAPLLGLPAKGPLIAHAVREMLLPNIKKIYGEKMAHHPDDATAKGEAWYLTGTFDTDGYSIHPHFQRRKTPEEASKPPSSKQTKPEKIAAPPRLLLLVDPGRVNVATITVVKDGKVVMRAHNGRERPLKFTFTTRQYYSLTGQTRSNLIRERRLRKDVVGAGLRKAQSATSLRTGDRRQVVEYIKASLAHAVASDQAWARALKKSAATERWRREAAKEGALLRWFYQVRRSVGAVTGIWDATVVWGCKVAATGKGNLSAPTERSANVAAQVKGWTLVRGDEYKTSALSCVAPHAKNMAPRFRGTVSSVRRRLAKGESVRNKVRDGWVESLSAKRCLRRVEYEGKAPTPIGEKFVKQPKQQTLWKYEGTSLDSDKVKAEKKKERQELGLVCKYVRGLRVFAKDPETTKFVDRDVNGSINIGILWLGDNIHGRQRPSVFVRPKMSKLAPV